MRNPGQIIPDHAAIVAMLDRAAPADPGAVVPGTVVRLSGTAQPGPGGMLTAPLSGRPCVWYRALVITYEKFGPLQWQSVAGTPRLPPVIGSDCGFGFGDHRTDEESGAPFVVQGARGGVVVDPVRADVHAAVISVDAIEGEYRFTRYVIRREWIVEAGAPVFAAGPVTVDGTPVLRAHSQQCLIVNATGERAAQERSRGAQAAAPAVAALRHRALLVGFTAGGVALVVVLVLVVVVLMG